jgi:hypothetical protein
MNPYSVRDLAQEAEELLSEFLTQEDWAEVLSNYKDISSQVRWGRVVDKLFADLLNQAHNLVFESGDWSDAQYSKSDMWHLPTDAEKRLYEDGTPKGMQRQHLLLLLVTRKILGIMKTKTKQGLKDLPVLTEEEELELQEYQDAAMWGDVEEENQAAQESEVVARLEREEPADLSLEGDCLQGGKHIRTVMRHRRRDDEVYFETFCKDCRKVVESVKYEKPERHRGPCQHEHATWVPGREGVEAVCSNPKCKETIPNPETYEWADVGLEPFGDDPSQDEVTTLCSDYSS